MKELNQHLKTSQRGLDFATGIFGAIQAYKGKLNPITRRMVQGPILEINDEFVMEHTAKLARLTGDAGIELKGKLTCREWFNVHRELKQHFGASKVLHSEHIAGGVKSICDHLIKNYKQFNSPEEVLAYIVDNTNFVARYIGEPLNENTSIEELEQYL